MILGRPLKTDWRGATVAQLMASPNLTLGFYHVRFRIKRSTRDELHIWLQVRINLGEIQP